jgi:hypothetical protein
VLLKIHIKSRDDLTPSSTLLEKLWELYTMLHKEDSSTVLAPWMFKSEAKLIAVPNHFPTTFQDLKPHVDKLAVRPDNDNWLKM